MGNPKKPYLIVAAVETALGRLASLAARRPIATLLVLLAVTLAALVPARRLSLNADLMGLLPDDAESVQALKQVKDRFGGFGYVAVVGRGGSAQALQAFADDLAPQLERLPTVRYVDYKRPQDFFQEHVLYFLETEDLKTLEERIAERVNWEKRQKNPLFVGLDDEGPPAVEVDDLVDKYKVGGAGRLSKVRESYYIDREEGLIALFVKPSGIGSDLNFSRRVVDDVKATVSSLDLGRYGSDFRVSLGGTFTKRVDQQELITRDLRLTTLVALVGILLYVVFYFRRLGAAALLFVPLLVGLAWTYGLAGLVFGRLNILTGFIGAILLGLGIDHGIHLLGRFESELKTRPFHEAIAQAFGRTGRAVVLAALTTLVAFSGLALSEFRAFREFGILAAFGITMVVLSTVLILPASLSLLSRWGWKPRAPSAGVMGGLVQALSRRPGVATAIAGVAFLALAASSFQGRFDYDTRALAQSHLESFKLDAALDGLLGYSMTPMVVLAKDQSHERRIVEGFRARKADRADKSTIDLVMAKSDFVPPHQAEKRAVIERIGKLIEPLEASDFEGDAHARFAALQQGVKALPFGYADIPAEIRRQFESPRKPGPGGASVAAEAGSFVLVFSSLDLSDGKNAIRFAEDVRNVPLEGGGTVSAAGEPLVLADVFSLVASEAPSVMGLTLVLVFLAMWLLLGSFRKSLLCLVPAALTLVGTFGLLPLLGLSFNTLNVVMIPVLFGMGVDGGVHLVTRRMRPDERVGAIAETAQAVLAALITTALGFGALVLADHSGLNSLGWVALTGLFVNALSCVVVLPAVLLWLGDRGRPQGAIADPAQAA